MYSLKAEKVRESYRDAFKTIILHVKGNKGQSASDYFLDAMMNNFPTKITLENRDKGSDKTSRCKEFFDLFRVIVKQVYGLDKNALDLKKIIDMVFERL